MGIEIELRARFDKATYQRVADYLHEHAEDLGENDKHLYLYVLPDKLLKVVKNISAGTAKISLKGSRIGQGSAFPEQEIEIPLADVSTAVQIVNELGFRDFMHEAVNQRHDFLLNGVEIALKYSDAWGYHAEFEIVLDEEAGKSDHDDAVARIHKVAEELGVHLMSDAELKEFTEQFERDQSSAIPVKSR